MPAHDVFFPAALSSTAWRRLRPWRTAVFALVALVAGCTPIRGPEAGTVTISVVGTADLHGAVAGEDGRGGLARFGGYLQNLRAARAGDGGGVLLVDAGDMFQGTLESNTNEGAAVVAAYNALGYDAAAIGNHEFDFGPAGDRAMPVDAGDDPQGALKARAAEARFPLLAANIIDLATGTPVRWPNVSPSVLLDIASIRVGVVGVTSETTPDTTMRANLAGLDVAPLVPAIVREAEALRARGASVVVVAAHAGGRCREWRDPDDLSSCDLTGEIFRAAGALPPGLVDVIVGGHTHQRLASRVSGTTVMQPGDQGRAFSRADVVVARGSRAVSRVRVFPPQDVCDRVDPATEACAAASDARAVQAAYAGRPVEPDASVERALAPARRHVEALQRAPLGVILDQPFRRERMVESALGNLVADAMRAAAARADVALMNGGGIRTDLPAGALTYGRLFEVLPFDNRLVTLAMRGDQLRRVLGHNLEASGPAPQILSISGVQVRAACEGATVNVQVVRPSGAPIADDEPLRVVTIDFVATGGDRLLVPAGPLPEAERRGDAPMLRDAVAEWLRARGGRLHPDEYLAAQARRWTFPGSRPVQCAAR